MSLYRNLVRTTCTVALLLFFSLQAGAEPIDYEGLIAPSEIIQIGAPAEGIVEKILVDRGSQIERDQLLVTLESSVESATVAELVARAGFAGEINEQRTQLAFAKRANDRIREVNVVPLHEKDQAATQASLSGYRLQKAMESQTLAQLEQKKAEAALARRSIRSPISGIVMDRFVAPGEYVNNQPLLRVAQVHPLRVEVILPASLFGKIQTGQRATIRPELPGYGQPTATVTLVDRFIDAASNTFGVRLELANLDRKIPSGLKCQVHFAEMEAAAMLPPATPMPETVKLSAK